MKWTTETRKLSEIIPYEHNPRQMTSDQYEALKASLEKFSLAEIPVINTDNKLLAGHQRVKILLELYGKDYEIPVRIPDKKLTEKDCQEYNIRSNKNTGSWDFDILANVFESEDLVQWGFSLDELPDLKDALESAEDNELEERPVYPLVPKFNESYKMFCIFTTNELDMTFVKAVLKLGRSQCYKSQKVAENFVCTAEQFRQALNDYQFYSDKNKENTEEVETI